MYKIIYKHLIQTFQDSETNSRTPILAKHIKLYIN